MITAFPAYAVSAPSPRWISKCPTPAIWPDLGPELARFFQEKGILLRPLGNTIYVHAALLRDGGGT